MGLFDGDLWEQGYGVRLGKEIAWAQSTMTRYWRCLSAIVWWWRWGEVNSRERRTVCEGRKVDVMKIAPKLRGAYFASICRIAKGERLSSQSYCYIETKFTLYMLNSTWAPRFYLLCVANNISSLLSFIPNNLPAELVYFTNLIDSSISLQLEGSSLDVCPELSASGKSMLLKVNFIHEVSNTNFITPWSRNAKSRSRFLVAKSFWRRWKAQLPPEKLSSNSDAMATLVTS